MDLIKKMAFDFNRKLLSHARSLENYDIELSSKLIYINRPSEKLRFLSYLKDFVESDYQKHIKGCPNPTSCGKNKSYEIAIYSIKQQYDDNLEIEDYFDASEKPAMKYFSKGQYFDAYTSIRECVKEAKTSIVLIDGFIDADTLAFFPGKEPSIKLRILTKLNSVNTSLSRAMDLYNKQYENLEVKTSEDYHDRFLILDDEKFYHIGASIKDAGNKTFMYSKIEDIDIINLIRKRIKLEFGNKST